MSHPVKVIDYIYLLGIWLGLDYLFISYLKNQIRDQLWLHFISVCVFRLQPVSSQVTPLWPLDQSSLTSQRWPHPQRRMWLVIGQTQGKNQSLNFQYSQWVCEIKPRSGSLTDHSMIVCSQFIRCNFIETGLCPAKPRPLVKIYSQPCLFWFVYLFCLYRSSVNISIDHNLLVTIWRWPKDLTWPWSSCSGSHWRFVLFWLVNSLPVSPAERANQWVSKRSQPVLKWRCVLSWRVGLYL